MKGCALRWARLTRCGRRRRALVPARPAGSRAPTLPLLAGKVFGWNREESSKFPEFRPSLHWMFGPKEWVWFCFVFFFLLLLAFWGYLRQKESQGGGLPRVLRSLNGPPPLYLVESVSVSYHTRGLLVLSGVTGRRRPPPSSQKTPADWGTRRSTVLSPFSRSHGASLVAASRGGQQGLRCPLGTGLRQTRGAGDKSISGSGSPRSAAWPPMGTRVAYAEA